MPTIPGFYVAHHRWLDAERGANCVFKVGMTGDLQVRLCDDAYTTCFPEGWRYVATVETTTRADAELLETAVLTRVAARRLDGRELVAASAQEIVAVAQAEASKLLGDRWTLRVAPAYAMHRREGLGGTRVPAPVDAATPVDAAASASAPPLPPAPAVPQYGNTIINGSSDGAAETCQAEVADLFADVAKNEFRTQAIEEREYQTLAIQRCLGELKRTGRGILQMACRCGKTRVAYGVLRGWMASPQGQTPAAGGPLHSLILVPGLHLLRQTAQKLAAYAAAAGHTGLPFLLIGSDPRPVVLDDGGGAESCQTMTTAPAEIAAALSGPPRVVVCTYQSSPLLPDVFSLQIFDEAHRICGSLERDRPFAAALLTLGAHARLFMTATPCYDRKPLTMRDTERFGGVAYRYHLRDGIRANYVNNYRLVFVGQETSTAAVAGDPTSETPAAPILAEPAIPGSLPGDATVEQILWASTECPRLLVFCRNIAHAEGLQAAVEARLAAAPPSEFLPPACFSAHSRMPSRLVAATVRAFAARDGEPGTRGHHILFNCRLFQEGVELPDLNGVVFAAPRHAPRDIIQSLCRPLNRRDGAGELKPTSAIYLPVRHDPGEAPDARANLEKFSTIVPFADALADEDPAFYEHLLDPAANSESLIEWASCGGGAHAASAASLLSAVRRVVRYGVAGSTTNRLLYTAKIPWRIAFPKMREIVIHLRRYVKTTDELVAGDTKIPFHRWYKWIGVEYRKFAAKKPSALSPGQVADLLTLPDWETRGVDGPYPWKESLDFLDSCLAANNHVPPPVEINKGGFVGLDATPMERLSGTLTCVNQSDGRRGNAVTLRPEQQNDLDELCARHGIRWRKVRNADGTLPVDKDGGYTGPPSFIQEAYGRFKAMYDAQEARGVPDPYIAAHFPGYPHKHNKQEILGYDRAMQPGRWRGSKKAAARRVRGVRAVPAPIAEL